MKRGLVGFVLMASVGVAALGPVSAKAVLTPGPKPTTIEPGRMPFTFAQPPTIRTAFGRDEPFLEGEIAYGYSGRVVTPIVRGSDVVAPAGSPAYGVPMRMRNAVADELVWCAATRKVNSPKIGAVCLFNEGLGFGGYDSLMTTAAFILDTDPYGGGEIVPGRFNLGAPVHVRCYVQNLGKIARVKGQIWIGDAMANQWGYIFGDIARGSQPAERLFAVGGGIVGITPDPAVKDHYLLRIVAPLKPQGGTPLSEVRNDSRVTGQLP